MGKLHFKYVSNLEQITNKQTKQQQTNKQTNKQKTTTTANGSGGVGDFILTYLCINICSVVIIQV